MLLDCGVSVAIKIRMDGKSTCEEQFSSEENNIFSFLKTRYFIILCHTVNST